MPSPKLLITVEARTIGGMLRQIVTDYPGLEPFIEAGVSVAIDGRIIANDLSAPVNEENEIYLLQQLKGG